MNSPPRNRLQKKKKTMKSQKHDLKGVTSTSHIKKAKGKKFKNRFKNKTNLLKTSTPKQATLISSAHFKNGQKKKLKQIIKSEPECILKRFLPESAKKIKKATEVRNYQHGSEGSIHSEPGEFYAKDCLIEPQFSNLHHGYQTKFKTKDYAQQSNILRNFSRDESDYSMMKVTSRHPSAWMKQKTTKKEAPENKKRCSNLCETPCSNLAKEIETGDPGKSCIFSIPSKNTLIVILDRGSKLSFEGLVNIQVISGTISILGMELSYGMPPVSAYSANMHCYLSIEAIKSEHVWKSSSLIAQLKKKLEAISSKKLTSNVFARYLNSSVIFTLEKNYPSMSLNFVRLYIPEMFQWNNDKLKNCITDLLKPYEVNVSLNQKWSICMDVYKSLATKVMSLIQISKVDLTPAPRILVYGPKNSGKSTFLRYLTNMALQRFDKICYLDCDPGQTEFTIAGCVSLTEVTSPLLGPPCTHLKDPLMTIFIGNNTAATSPEMYCKSIIKLVEYYKANCASYPLFINTMGWLIGIGAECLTRTIKAALPTLLVELIPEDDVSTYSYAQHHNAKEIGEHISVSVAAENANNQVNQGNGLLFRNLMVLSYFGKCLHSFDQLMSLNAIEPYRVSWDNLALYVCNTYVSPDKLTEAMNASLVALCRVDESLILDSHIHSYPKTLVDDPENECFGFGIVRAMHRTKHFFYIVTPVPIEKLRMVNALIKGNIGIPSEMLLKQEEIVNIQVPYTKVIADTPPMSSKAVKGGRN